MSPRNRFVCALSGIALVASLASARVAQDRDPKQAPTPAPGPAGGRGATKPTPQRPATEDPGETYFEICDYNSDGWISFKEAQASLAIDRESFGAFDQDVDGRIDAAEFKRRYHAIVDVGGAFPKPVSKEKSARAPKRDAAELLAAYDRDHDKTLDQGEVATVLADYQVKNLDAAVALEKLDRDADGRLQAAEIDELARIIAPPETATARTPTASTVAELFGKSQPRETKLGSTPTPPRIPGPVSAFRRLDLDADGRITQQDLIDLQRPLQLSVRSPVVLATLDEDGDGAISETELLASMRSARP